MGKAGCNADGVNVKCRFCGAGNYSKIPCEASQVCKFAAPPSVPYYWDSSCHEGMLGCLADGVHAQCRFCSKRPFEDIPCPEEKQLPTNACVWPVYGEPKVEYFWDETCEMGKLGCWADGFHAQCRFCGSSVYSNITCPGDDTAAEGTGGSAATLMSVSPQQQQKLRAAGFVAARSSVQLRAVKAESVAATAAPADRAQGAHHEGSHNHGADEEHLSGTVPLYTATASVYLMAVLSAVL